jgi:hypothetical protein
MNSNHENLLVALAAVTSPTLSRLEVADLVRRWRTAAILPWARDEQTAYRDASRLWGRRVDEVQRRLFENERRVYRERLQAAADEWRARQPEGTATPDHFAIAAGLREIGPAPELEDYRERALTEAAGEPGYAALARALGVEGDLPESAQRALRRALRGRAKASREQAAAPRRMTARREKALDDLDTIAGFVQLFREVTGDYDSPFSEVMSRLEANRDLVREGLASNGSPAAVEEL